MRIIENIFIVFLAIVLIFIFVSLSKQYLKTWINPVSVYIFVWGIYIIMFFLYSDRYIIVPINTWYILIFSVTSYCVGAYLFWFNILNSAWLKKSISPYDRVDALRNSMDKVKMKRSIYFIIIAGSIFFIVYINVLGGFYNISYILSILLDTRVTMKEEGALPGYHYVYFWEMLLPLTVVYYVLYGKKKNILMMVLALLLTFLLVFSTAKTNIIKALLWAFIIYSLLKYEKINMKNLIINTVLVFVVGIAVFIIHTNYTGELIDKSAQIDEIIARFSASLPVFHLLINDPEVMHSYGKLMFLPIFKLLQIIDPQLFVPSHILQFYNVPFLFNLATYLDVFYRDFGYFGVLIMPGVFGYISAKIFYLYRINIDNYFVLFVMSIILLWVIGSPSTAGFIKPSYWFQIIFGYAMYKYIKKHKSASNG